MPLLNHSHMVSYSDSESDRGLQQSHCPKKEPRTSAKATMSQAQGAIIRSPNGPIIVNGFSIENPTINLANLANMPAINKVELRDDSADLKFDKKYKAESFLIISRGILQVRPCTRCREGRGPYKRCIRVPDICTGACGNCTWGSNLSRCSCREDVPELAVKPEPHNIKPKRKRKVVEPSPAPRPSKQVKQRSTPIEQPQCEEDYSDEEEDEDDSDEDAPANVVSDLPIEPRTEFDIDVAVEEAQRLEQDELLQVRKVQALRLAILDREIAARKYADADNVLVSYSKRRGV